MQKIVALVAMFVLIGFQVQAKTIVVGAHGGIEMYSSVAGNGEWYNPVSKWSGKNSVNIGSWINRFNWGSHGVDAAIVYFKENSNNSLETRVADRFSGTWRTTHYITSHYSDGDKVVLIGYSAGANHMLAVASYLKLFGYPVDILALMDPVVSIFYIPSNVKKVALYYQTEGTPMQHGFHNFVIVDSSKTSYYSGHPKLVTNITVDPPVRTAHLSLPYETSVWQDLGQKMVDLNSSTPFYNRWWMHAYGLNICQASQDYWWSYLANNLKNQYDCSNEDDIQGTLVTNEQTNEIDFAPGVQNVFDGNGSSNLPPVSGDKTDLTPDFDIYNEQGQEISANNSNDPIQTVQVGQRIKLNLTTEVHNDDTENHLRNSNSNSIEGPIYYWIEGVVIIW